MNFAQKILDNAQFIDESNLGELDTEARQIHDFIMQLSQKMQSLAEDEVETWLKVVDDPRALIIAIPQAHFKSVVSFMVAMKNEMESPDSLPFHKMAMEALRAQVLLQTAAFYQAIINNYADPETLKIMEQVAVVSKQKLKERKNRSS